MSARPVLIAALLLAACGEKEPTTTAAPAEAAQVANSNVPGDKASQEFAEKLFAANLGNFRPVDAASGATLVYDSFTFRTDGTWTATGKVTAIDEAMECHEDGTWVLDAAEDANTAPMLWTVVKTNCAGRESGTETRVRLTLLKDGQYKVDFR